MKRTLLPRLQDCSARHQEIVLVLLTISILGGLYFYNLDGWLIDDDEGTFLYQAWRVSEGQRPYTDFLTSRWPLFLYTAGALVDLSGRSIWTIRAVSVLLTIATALIVFLLARRFLPAEGAWIAILAFLLHPAVFFRGRLFYPEHFMLFFATLGLYLFDRGWNGQQGKVITIAGLSFGIATLYKSLGLLPLAGCSAWIVIDALQQRRNWRLWIVQLVAFLLPYGLLVGASFLGFMLWTPAFYSSVIGINLAQGQELGRIQVAINAMTILLVYLVQYLPLMAFALPAAWASARKNKRGSLIAWQLPTALAFLVIARDLSTRHLLYLAPSLAILFALALEPLCRWPRRSFLFASVFCAVVLPWVLQDTVRATRTERDTDKIVELIRSRIDKEAYLLSDYQELNFHAGRRSTYLSAEISKVIVEDEQITGEQLIEEMEKHPVEMVILDVSKKTAHQLVALVDYEKFRSYLEENFELLGPFPRGEQELEIYVLQEHAESR